MSRQKNKRNTRRGRAKRWKRGLGSVMVILRPRLGYVQRTIDVALRYPHQTDAAIEHRDGRWYSYVCADGLAVVTTGFPNRAAAMRAAEHLARQGKR